MIVEKPKWRKNITCPKCEREYEISEVFYPESFFGEARKDQTQIPSNFKETFICDKCGKKMSVTAYIKYNTELIEVEDSFNQDVILSLVDEENKKINLI